VSGVSPWRRWRRGRNADEAGWADMRRALSKLIAAGFEFVLVGTV